MKKVTIHQPDFMPWLGFFNKVKKADLFVVLDHTENNPRDSNFWGRRVTILSNKKELWYSIPLVKPEKGIVALPINEMQINLTNEKEINKRVQQIKQSYSKHEYFKEVFPLVEKYFSEESASLKKRNMAFITEVMRNLDIDTEVVYSSDLDCKEKSTELLVEILKKVDGEVYLCGGGASGYQDDQLFEENNIALEYNNFNHPIYTQKKSESFVKGLSIIDALMNLGFEGVKEIL